MRYHDYDFEDFEDNFGPYKPRNPRRKRTNQKGGNTMDDLFNFESPIGILSIIGAAIGIHRLVTKTWIWNSLGKSAPTSRQLPIGRRVTPRPGMRPAGARPTPGMAQPNSIQNYRTLYEGGRNAQGMWEETIQIICP